MSNFTKQEQEYIKKYAFGKTTEELTKLVNKKFNKDYTEYMIYRYKKRNHIKSGIDTKFKKGRKAYNHKPIGSEFISKDGYTYIKVSEPNNWKRKSVYVYEKTYGKIPEGYTLIFADRNKRNFDLKNLILVRNKDKLVMKNLHLLSENKEITKTGLLIAKLINDTATIKRRIEYEK